MSEVDGNRPISYTAEAWADIRRRYEAGETAGMISRSLGGSPSKVAINNKANKEAWERLSERLPLGNDGNTLVIPADMDPRREAALQVLADGGNYKDAAIAAHVDESTFREWRKDQEYQRLCQAAISGLKIEMLGIVKRGAQRDPKNAIWLLEHHPTTRSDFGTAHVTHLGIQHNYLAQIAPNILGMGKPELPALDGDVVRDEKGADE